MSEYTIGIKTGDGQFFPVLEESFQGKKRFVLTTVNDNQTSVQIDFYKSIALSMKDAEYIGSLVIEEIQPGPRKGPEIEVIVGVDTANSLHATARNLASDDRQSLTVSLESLGSTYGMPDFEIDENIEPSGLFEEDITQFPSENEDDDQSSEPEEKKKVNLLGIILFVLLGLALVAGITIGIFFLINKFSPDSRNPLDPGDSSSAVVKSTDIPVPTEVLTPKPETTPTKEPAPTVEAAIATPKPVEKVVKQTEPQTGGIIYIVKKGDTLWDIAEKHYGDPWSFYKIYSNNLNKIPYPSLIFIGTKLYIP